MERNGTSMKLRNKKTGESINIDKFPKNLQDAIKICAIYFWRDYEIYNPAEPLIKDEKIRKAVRAWAEANGIEKVLSYGGTFWLGFRSINTESVWKFECNYVDASDFEDKEFSIEELCGEDE